MFNSDSRTKVRISNSDQRIAAAQGSQVNAPRASTGNKGKINLASQGGIVVSGKGNTVSTTTTDYGALAAANAISAESLRNQANLAATAIGAANDATAKIKDLAETKLTNGDNLQNRTLQNVGIAAAAVVALFLFLRK